jgi:hypothetical protein
LAVEEGIAENLGCASEAGAEEPFLLADAVVDMGMHCCMVLRDKRYVELRVGFDRDLRKRNNVLKNGAGFCCQAWNGDAKGLA